jgi:flagellar hook-associated protein 2
MSSISSANPSALSTGASPALTFTGLASGIDTNAIIQQLVAVQQKQVTNLQNQQSTITNQETTFKSIEADLLDLQSQASSLSQSINGVFDARSVTSSDQTIATGAASSDATPGVYSFRVNGLATAQAVASQGFSSPGATITQGTFGIQVGSGPVSNITIDNSNNTLQGLATAINNSGAGVTASIVNDGASSQAYRLLLTSNSTGTSNGISITNSLGSDSGGATQPVLGASYIGNAVAASGDTSTSTVSSNAGAGGYTGSSNDTYTFTVANGGTVGTSNGITLKYSDSAGSNKGTITLNSTDAGVAQSVGQGIQVAFAAGTLVSGDTFSVQAFNPNVQQATNASVTVGSGNGALTVTSPTNQLNNVIPGVTLNLVGANPNENVSLTVAANTNGIATAVQNFVNSYNTVISAINNATSFDPSTNTAGPLLGNGAVSSIQSQLAQAAGTIVPGLAQANNLTAIGITNNADGTLSLNTTTLNNALNGQVPGVSLNDVKNLFTLSGQSNNPGVQFVAGTDSTHATASPTQVVITQAATQGTITGTSVLSQPVTITSSNDTFTLSVDGGTAQTISIPPGDYTPLQLSEAIEAQVAANAVLAGGNVQVFLSGSQLSFASGSFGSASNVTIGTGNALPTLGFTPGQSGSGLNVAGHFVVNGATEAATGNGQILTGGSGNANTSGLEVQVSLTPTQVAANPQVNLTVSRGVASTLNQTLDSLLNPTSGRLQTVDQSFESQIQNFQNQINQSNTAITQQETQLTAQFASLEGIISQLKNESSIIGTLTPNQTSSLIGLSPASSTAPTG